MLVFIIGQEMTKLLPGAFLDGVAAQVLASLGAEPARPVVLKEIPPSVFSRSLCERDVTLAGRRTRGSEVVVRAAVVAEFGLLNSGNFHSSDPSCF